MTLRAALLALAALYLTGCVAGLVVALDRPGCTLEQSVEEALQDGLPSTLKAEVRRSCPPAAQHLERRSKP